jgi:DNA-binding GntR family transcriptional regulator
MGSYGRLRDLIVRGRLAPGMPLIEAEVARHLGCSRTPIREALQRLRRDGLAVAAGGGARPRLIVAPMSRDAIDELYQAMGALEGVAARNIGRLAPPLRLALARRLAELHAEFRRTVSTRNTDWDALFERHDAFHRALQDAGAGPRIRALLDDLRPQVDRYEWLFAPLTGPDFSATNIEHGTIVRAVRNGTAAAIERAVRANWFNGRTRLGAAIDGADDALLAGRGWERALRPERTPRPRTVSSSRLAEAAGEERVGSNDPR